MKARLPFLALVVLQLPARALAHPAVERGVSEYYAADLEHALASFAEAEAGGGLARSDLQRLLLFRALVHSAFGSEAARDADLLRLASLSPDTPLAVEIPPKVRQAYLRARRSITAPLAVTVRAVEALGTVELRAMVDADPGGLARELHLAAGDPRQGSPARLIEVAGAVYRAPSGPGASVVYRAWAVGPGGATIAELGSAAAPLVWRSTAPALVPPVAEEGQGVPTWAWLAGGAATAAIVTVVVIALQPSRETVLLGPSFQGAR